MHGAAFTALTFGVVIILLLVSDDRACAQDRGTTITLAQASPAGNPTHLGTPTPPSQAQPPTQAHTPTNVRAQQSGSWTSRCTSEGRQSTLECVVEQTAVLANTGQLVAAVVVRVPSDTRKPVMTIQVPVGLWLPAGLVFQIDEAKPQQLPVQTCDLKGCYAETPVSPELLAALKAGKSLAITFQTLAKENFSVPLPLVNFAEVYQKIQ